MKHKFALCAFLFVLLIILTSTVACLGKPAPGVQWYRTFGGGSGNSVQQTTDGGYIVCGFIRSYGAGGHDILLIKTDADGNKLWDKTFDFRRHDYGNSVQQTADGGYIICGTSGSYYGAGDADVWLIKTDADGNKLWDKIFGGKKYNEGNSVQQTADGGYIICGTTGSYYYNSDVWLIKTDADGDKLWEKTFGGTGLNGGNSVQKTTDGGYVVCGYTELYGNSDIDVWLIKTDADGNKLWDKTFGFRKSDYGYSVQQTADGGYIICGYIISRWHAKFSISKLLLIKTDTKGNKLWNKAFGSVIGYTHGFSVRQTTDGGYIVCGYEYTLGPSEVLLLKLASEQ